MIQDISNSKIWDLRPTNFYISNYTNQIISEIVKIFISEEN